MRTHVHYTFPDIASKEGFPHLAPSFGHRQQCARFCNQPNTLNDGV